MRRKNKEKRILNQSQKGYSMIEMLGVLAIVGILSIGGVSGYQLAMARKKAVDITDYISLLAIRVASRDQVYSIPQNCSNFNTQQLVMPEEYFSQCTLTTDAYRNVFINVETQDTMSEQIVAALAQKCTPQFYVSTDAKQFIVGNSPKACGTFSSDPISYEPGSSEGGS